MATTVTFGERGSDDYSGVTKDTWISQAASTTNYSSDTELEVYKAGGVGDKAPIIGFDLSDLIASWDPDTHVVTSVTMGYYVNSNAGDTAILWVPVGRSWVESEATYTIPATGKTWLRINYTDLECWANPSTGGWKGQYASKSGTGAATMTGTNVQNWVQMVLDGRAPTPDGWLSLYGVGAGWSLLQKIDSSKASTASQRPYLSITYDTVTQDTVTIKTGGDYTTLSGWESGEAANLVTSTTRHFVNFDANLDISGTAVDLGFTCDAKYYVVMDGQPEGADGINDISNPSLGDSLELSGIADLGVFCLTLSNTSVLFRNMAIWCDADLDDGIQSDPSGSNTTQFMIFEKCFFVLHEADDDVVQWVGNESCGGSINTAVWIDGGVSGFSSGGNFWSHGTAFVRHVNGTWYADAGMPTASEFCEANSYRNYFWNMAVWDSGSATEAVQGGPADCIGGNNADYAATHTLPDNEGAACVTSLADSWTDGENRDLTWTTFASLSGGGKDWGLFAWEDEDLEETSRRDVTPDIGAYQENEGTTQTPVEKIQQLTAETLLQVEDFFNVVSEMVLQGTATKQLVAEFTLRLPPKVQQLVAEMLGGDSLERQITAEMLGGVSTDKQIVSEFITQIEKLGTLPAEFVHEVQKVGVLYVVFEYNDNGTLVRHTPGTLLGETRETTGALLRGTRNTLGTLLGETRE